jgi:hypothetical protein
LPPKISLHWIRLNLNLIQVAWNVFSIFSFKWNSIFTKSTLFFHHFIFIGSEEKFEPQVKIINPKMVTWQTQGTDWAVALGFKLLWLWFNLTIWSNQRHPFAHVQKRI